MDLNKSHVYVKRGNDHELQFKIILDYYYLKILIKTLLAIIRLL